MISADEYQTISEPGTAQTRVLGSRFLGTALSAHSEADIESHLEAEHRRFHDATHICFAARMGTGHSVTERTSDSGEPKGTAGIPIIREIRGRGLTDCLVLVTRYFGGTKLGTGNLARAYADCAAQALGTAQIIRKTIFHHFVVECPFELQGTVYRIAEQFRALVEPEYTESQAVFRLAVPASGAALLVDSLRDATRGNIVFKFGEPWN